MYNKVHLKRLIREPQSVVLTHSNIISMGCFGIISCEPGFLTIEQIESVRKVFARHLKPINGKYWICITSFVSLTKKSKGARMGKGKGAFYCKVAPIQYGQLLFQFMGLDDQSATELYKVVASKLPLQVTLIKSDLEK